MWRLYDSEKEAKNMAAMMDKYDALAGRLICIRSRAAHEVKSNNRGNFCLFARAVRLLRAAQSVNSVFVRLGQGTAKIAWARPRNGASQKLREIPRPQALRLQSQERSIAVQR
jgi:hypothetical protein